MNSRTNFRLQLQREQSIQEQTKTNEPMQLNGNIIASARSEDGSARNSCSGADFNKIAPIPVAERPLKDQQQPKSLPVIISQPIRFNGNRLVHLPPQIIHVQQHQVNNSEVQATAANCAGGRKVVHSSISPPSAMTLSSSSMPAQCQQQPANKGLAKMPNAPPNNDLRSQRVTVAASGFGYLPQQHQQVRTSKQSYSELSPTETVYADSPCSASFTSAQSELDDVIIDEILSMEEEQRRRCSVLYDNDEAKHQHKLVSSLSYADDLEGLLTVGGRTHSHSSFGPQRQVSNSAPSASIDIEGLVRDELSREQELMRDRRKKDVHNMIERRRRYNINDRIKELGSLLPKSCTEEMKLNKGTILQASVDYIMELRKDRERLLQMQQKHNLLEDENMRMQRRIQDLEERLRANGINLPSPYEPLTPSQNAFRSKMIKSEPVEDEVEMAGVVGHQISIPSKAEFSPSPSGDRSASQTPPSTSSATTGILHNSAFDFGHQPTGCRDIGNTGIQEIYGFNSLPANQYNPNNQSARYFIREAKPANQIQVAQNSELDGYVSQGRHHSLSGLIVDGVSSAFPHQQQSPYSVTTLNPNFQDFMMELSGADVLTTTCDPMMSDTGLLLGSCLGSSQVSSPDIHWDSGAFSPESQHHGGGSVQQQQHQQPERMDFVTT